MATPEFVLSLREKIGGAPLPLVGVTAVVFKDEKVLLGRRADNGAWQSVSGIVDPGEEPADAAVRECREEAGVTVRATRLALVQQLPRITYANGDQVDYLDLVFRCDWVSGEPHPADGELTEVGWYGLGELTDVEQAHVRKIALALAEDDPAAFAGGR
ncbi:MULTISPECIES: NUDIX domain-containing protein [Microbacterium]|uniref:NUDIX domain-containing protein n=1 Tax=Microbacterium hominis TaxID=162426 RepID=A0A134DK68_9MICO|nr:MULTISPECIES: NUDIX domain-containing protein [Microbacterium]AUG30040.1 NUDIX domain-containing protein [Microbacterium hominis]KXC06946.1 NTP pyrophosphohydrolase [Microbacterium hominis]QOC25751.1 NUDIX domain-containing protein [Microbacterium hominis]QOC29740.1 NUDIX domain-containing protein [Microbacterium hominis]QYF97875.1 NUDIX domain-containing protein [Microbacterium sp. PAMC21962]